MDDVCIEFRGVGLTFGQRVLFVDMNETFESSTSTALLGPSGSGKTSALALAGGLLSPSSGAVVYKRSGEPIEKPRFSWVTQTTNSVSSRTAVENVAIGYLPVSQDWRECLRRANVLLADVGLGSAANRKCRSLSGGELQRVVVARAIISEPDFLVADEPTGQLDRSTSDVVADILAAHALRAGLIVATHDESVATRCQRVLEIGDGRLRC